MGGMGEFSSIYIQQFHTALSRLINSHQQPDEETVIAAISVEDDIRRQMSDTIRGIPVIFEEILTTCLLQKP